MSAASAQQGMCMYICVACLPKHVAHTTLMLGFTAMRSLGHTEGPTQLYFPMLEAKAQEKNKCRQQAARDS